MSERYPVRGEPLIPNPDKDIGELVTEIVHRYSWGSDTLEMKWDSDFEMYLVKYGTDTAANPDLRVALSTLLEGLKS